MNYKNKEKFIAHAIFLTGTILVLYPFFSILFLALSEPGKRISGFTLPSGIYFDNFIKAWVGGSFNTGLLNSFIIYSYYYYYTILKVVVVVVQLISMIKNY